MILNASIYSDDSIAIVTSSASTISKLFKRVRVTHYEWQVSVEQIRF